MRNNRGQDESGAQNGLVSLAVVLFGGALPQRDGRGYGWRSEYVTLGELTPEACAA
jgi:hypothetical protein